MLPGASRHFLEGSQAKRPQKGPNDRAKRPQKGPGFRLGELASFSGTLSGMGTLQKPQGIEIMDRAQAAAAIGVSSKTMANWSSMGVGPAYTRIGVKVYYRVAAIEAWAAAELAKVA